MIERHHIQRPGATGRFPEGKLNPSDEGELQFAVSIEAGHVRIDFGKPVYWMAMRPAEARDMALLLIESADAISSQGRAPTIRRLIKAAPAGGNVRSSNPHSSPETEEDK